MRTFNELPQGNFPKVPAEVFAFTPQKKREPHGGANVAPQKVPAMSAKQIKALMKAAKR